MFDKPQRWILGLAALATPALAGIHSAPIVIPARTIRAVQYHPVEMYRVFRTSPDGKAIPIPFQIDEKDQYGDYILPSGPNPNTSFSNGIFDYWDELSIMGGDVGPRQVPTEWPGKRPPSVLYEILFKNGDREGAIYVGAYFNHPPPLAKSRYVNFSLTSGEVVTSRYRYRFNPKNYLVVKNVDLNHPKGQKSNLLTSSTFYLSLDLKYFFTIDINHTDIASEMDAYKDGPIRTIARVNFNLNILKLNFDLGMYTEVSFFANSVILPAVVDNPLDGHKILNNGSEFYYGFSFRANPKDMQITSNMPRYKRQTFFDMFRRKQKAQDFYWLTALAKDHMIHMEFGPSTQMKRDGNVPSYYLEEAPGDQLKGRTTAAAPLGKSPVNAAISFDLANFSAGIHEIAFRLFIENTRDTKLLAAYKRLDRWKNTARRIPSSRYKKGRPKGALPPAAQPVVLPRPGEPGGPKPVAP